jgi:hypothetical protein
VIPNSGSAVAGEHVAEPGGRGRLPSMTGNVDLAPVNIQPAVVSGQRRDRGLEHNDCVLVRNNMLGEYLVLTVMVKP